jgi:hypothetical protein
MPAQRTGGPSVNTWSGWYWLAREDMAFRYGIRRVPTDRYKEQHALGRTPTEAAKAIYDQMQARGEKGVQV